MLHKFTIACVLLITLLPHAHLRAADQSMEHEIIYGWHLMSREERQQYKARLRHIQSEQKREAYQRRHRQRMRQRAQRLGIELAPVEPFQGDGNRDPMSGHVQR